MVTKSDKQTVSKFKQARLRSGLTQSALASKAGVSENYYARVERGEVSPTLEKFEKIVKALKIKSSEILNF